MTNLFSSIARLLGRPTISNQEVLEVLRSHEKRIEELELGFDRMAQTLEDRYADLAKKGVDAKKQAAKDLKQLSRELEALVSAIEVVVAGELAPSRRKDINKLLRMARGRRTRLNNILADKAA